MGEAEQASCRESARLVGGRVLVAGIQTQPLHPSHPTEAEEHRAVILLFPPPHKC